MALTISRKYVDKEALRYFWAVLKNMLNDKSPLEHGHSVNTILNLPTVAKTGNYEDLTNKPTIPTVPTSLPANGGNADTVDGIHVAITSSAPTSDNRKIMTIVI